MRQITKTINKKLWYLFAIAFFVSSCKFTEPAIGDFNIKDMRPKNDGDFIIEVSVEVDNPNTFNIWLKDGKMDVIIGKEKMGTLTTIGKVILKKKKKDDYSIYCLAKIDPSSILFGMLTGLGGNNNKPITFKGDIRAGVFIFSQKFDINFDDRLPSMSLFGN